VRRREFITLLGGAVAAWPLAVSAQQAVMPVIGFLHSSSPDAYADRLRVFRQGLKDAGFVEGENVTIEYRWAEPQWPRLDRTLPADCRNIESCFEPTRSFLNLLSGAKRRLPAALPFVNYAAR